jgi:hypothetical protein
MYRHDGKIPTGYEFVDCYGANLPDYMYHQHIFERGETFGYFVEIATGDIAHHDDFLTLVHAA